LAFYDTPNRVVISYIVDLPFGKGQPYANSLNGFGDRLISGWGVNGATTFQSGNPLPLTMAVNTTNSFGGGQRPNSTGVSANLEGPAQQRITKWFDTSQFTAPAAFTFGNLARTLPDVRSAGIANYDFTLFKNTKISERFGLQFRAEIFNLFNRVQFGYPGRGMGNADFGVISGQANNPRLIQFALRLQY